jgi:hypothetical protein
VSAWWRIFNLYPKSEKWIGCELTDGSYLSGQLYSFNLDPEETEDRELVIRNPLYRAPGATDDPEELGSALTTISARQIRFLSITYRTTDDRPEADRVRDRILPSLSVLRGVARAVTIADDFTSETGVLVPSGAVIPPQTDESEDGQVPEACTTDVAPLPS